MCKQVGRALCARLCIAIAVAVVAGMFGGAHAAVAAAPTHDFDYVVVARGTENVVTHPAQSFTWTMQTATTETWPEKWWFSQSINESGYETYDSGTVYGPSSPIVHDVRASNASEDYAYYSWTPHNLGTTNPNVTWSGSCYGWQEYTHNGFGGGYYIDENGSFSFTLDFGQYAGSAPRTLTQSASGSVSSADGLKIVATVDLSSMPTTSYADATLSAPVQTVSSNNPNVSVQILRGPGNTGYIVASTNVSGSISKAWTGSFEGTGSVTASEGVKVIGTCDLVAPNGDTTYRVIDDSDAVITQVAGATVRAWVAGEPTTLSIAATRASASMGTTVSVQGALACCGDPIPSPSTQQVSLQRSPDGVVWTQVGTARWDASKGAYVATTTIDCTTYFRLQYLATQGYAPSTSAAVPLSCQALISLVPTVAPTTPTHAKAFTITADVAPSHAGTTVFELYRLVSRAYTKYATKPATNRTVLGTGSDRYAVTVTLPKGTWRVRAVHQDASHDATYSGYRTFTVK